MSGYAIITRDETVLTLDVEGTRALAVFESAGAAEEFRLLRGLAPGWVVVDDPDGALPEYLRAVVAPRVGYVAVDPPVALRGGEPPAVALIPIERFLEDV
jgi:hypothetical protein